jgi:hypothetical protein
VPGLSDRGRATAGHDPDGLGRDRFVSIGADHAALSLADDFRSNHQDVAVDQVGRGRDDQLGQAGARRDLGQTRNAGDSQLAHRASSVARSIAALAIIAVVATSVMYSGRARTSIPASSVVSTAATALASDESTSQPSSRSGP